MNKRLSVRSIVSGIFNTAKRFPVPVLVAVIGTVLGIMLLHEYGDIFVSKLFLTILLAFPLYIAATIYNQEQVFIKTKIIVYSIVTVFLACYFFVFAKDLFNDGLEKQYIQYIVWIAASLLLVLSVPFIRNAQKSILDFWYHTKRVCYAFLTTALYSIVIYAGLSIALLSVKFLFDLDIDSIRWAELWVVTVGIFATIFFLARFPSATEVEDTTIYPKELKIFTHYVLAPLVGIYFLILYSYSAKILISWEWPKGIISYMILGFSALGVCTYAMVYPLISTERTLQKISTIFFGALLPQIAVLFFAVRLRISDYGITEKRYLLVVFGFWLLGISLYFLCSKVKNIRIIFTSLFVLLVVISFGPWGMFSVSKESQVHRLEALLSKNGMLVDGKAKKLEGEISQDDKKEINEIVEYLDRAHGLEVIGSWFSPPLQKIDTATCTRACSQSTQVIELLGVPRYGLDEYEGADRYYFTVNKNKYSQNIDVQGYDYVINESSKIDINGTVYRFELKKGELEYLVYKNDSVIATIPFKEFYDSLVNSAGAKKDTEFTGDDMTLTFENSVLKTKILFYSINGNMENLWTEETILMSIK